MRKELLAMTAAVALAVGSGAAFADDNNAGNITGGSNYNDNFAGSSDTINDSNGAAIVRDSGNTDAEDSFNTDVHVEDIGLAVSSNEMDQWAVQVNAQGNAAYFAVIQANKMKGGDVDVGSDNDIVGAGLNANTGFNALQGAQSAFSVGVGDVN